MAGFTWSEAQDDTMLAQRVRVGIKTQKKTRKSVASTHQFVRSDLPCLLPYSSVIKLRAPPGLVYQEKQVMDPIVCTNPAWVDNVAKIVFGIRDNKIGMGN